MHTRLGVALQSARFLILILIACPFPIEDIATLDKFVLAAKLKVTMPKPVAHMCHLYLWSVVVAGSLVVCGEGRTGTNTAGLPDEGIVIPTPPDDSPAESSAADSEAETDAETRIVSPAEVTASSDSDAVNVVDFGASGADTLDDTEAFRQAIATRKPVWIPPGNYYLKETISLEKGQPLILQGSGRAEVNLRPAAGLVTAFSASGKLDISDLRFEGLAVDSAAVSDLPRKSFVQWRADTATGSLKRVTMNQCPQYCFEVVQLNQQLVIEESLLNKIPAATPDFQASAVYVFRGRGGHFVFRNNVIANAPSDLPEGRSAGGIVLYSLREEYPHIKATIENNRFSNLGFDNGDGGNPTGAIDFYGQIHHSLIRNNLFQNSYYSPIKIANSSHLQILDNQIVGKGFDFGAGAIEYAGCAHRNIGKVKPELKDKPVYCSGSGADVLIQGNEIRDFEGSLGISVASTPVHEGPNAPKTLVLDLRIRRNTLAGYRYGMFLRDVSSPVIEGNILNGRNTALNGVYIRNGFGQLQVSGGQFRDHLHYGVLVESDAQNRQSIHVSDTSFIKPLLGVGHIYVYNSIESFYHGLSFQLTHRNPINTLHSDITDPTAGTVAYCDIETPNTRGELRGFAASATIKHTCSSLRSH